MPVEPKDFKAALGHFVTGVTVLTVRTPDGNDHGMTASAFCSVALDPPLVLVCIRKGNATGDFIDLAKAFAVNLLAEDQVAISNRFAGRGPDPQDRFQDLALVRAPVSGAAWLEGAIARLDCLLHETTDGGDHTIYVGSVEASQVAAGGSQPLIYWAGAYRSLGAKL